MSEFFDNIIRPQILEGRAPLPENYLAGDAANWYESGACTDVEIRGNKIIMALTSKYEFTNAIFSFTVPALNVLLIFSILSICSTSFFLRFRKMSLLQMRDCKENRYHDRRKQLQIVGV